MIYGIFFNLPAVASDGICWFVVYIMFVLAAVVAAPIEVTDVGAVVVVEVKIAAQANIH